MISKLKCLFVRAISLLSLSVSIVLATYSAQAQTVLGVTAEKIRIGVSTNMTGPSSDRAKEILHGSEIVFKKINAAGGIHGRKIEALILDDAYEPARSVQNARKLIESEKVFALFGFFGAPSSKALLPYLKETGIPFVAPGSGVLGLRTPVTASIFNVRLSYAQEIEPLVDHLVKNGIKEIAVLYQADALGQEVLDGVKAAMAKYKLSVKGTASWVRSNDKSVDQAFEIIRKSNPEAVILAVVFQPAAEFVKKAKEASLTWSFVGPTSLATASFLKEVGAGAEGIVVSNSFPPSDSKLQIVADFKADHAAHGRKDPANIEGYLSALVLAEGLKRAGKDLTRASLLKALESMDGVDFGGIKISFSPKSHQGLNSAFMSVAKDGKFVLMQN